MRVPASGQSNIPLSLKSEKVVNAVNPEVQQMSWIYFFVAS